MVELFRTFTSELGFSYTYDSDWERVDTKPIMPVVKSHAENSAKNDAELQTARCLQVALILQHGAPHRSSIVLAVLPNECLGSGLKPSSLSGVASGVAAAVQGQFIIKDPQYVAYVLGGAEFWAERAQGTAKEHPETTATLETVCAMLKSGLACWMGFLRDEQSVRAFEGSSVAVSGNAALPLIPKGIFEAAKVN
ncbi:MAG TPA: hypothetical protein VN151_01415 [Terracidiphilus sp.]|nr:hypothetical protein [Terracidiphilus sp.]